jgi:rhodanese-related sulfurtransferase
MNKNYILLMAILILLGGGLVMLPSKNVSQGLNPEKLMWDVVQPTRYLTSDEVAKMIIERDPLLKLVDVRPKSEYEQYSLTKAFNLPLDSLINPATKEFFLMGKENIVFYSNDDLTSDQAWVIAKRLGYKNIYVLKGGLNNWFNTIILPTAPPESASTEELNQYAFRQGASMYFTGAKIKQEKSTQAAIVPIRKKKTKAVAGGC